jgi:hypothetical protein
MKEVEDLPDGTYNIAIKLSGGADSSLIYYALCNKFKNNKDVNIIPVTLGTDLKPDYIPYSKKIIDIVYNLTGKKPLDHIIRYIKHDPIEYDLEQIRMVEYVIEKYKVRYCFSGLTINPPYKEMVKYFSDNCKTLNLDLSRISATIESRDKSRDTSTYVSNDFSQRPFGNNDKKYVAKYYKKYNVLESLYPYTHSCEAFEKATDHDGNALHCGHCYFCAERWWGFGRLV